ncbi:SGNH/GDSL hydrolase family protein [Bradyrhizobium sp.]|uniref:SGNH/GDSL hydrolase family protein n=1 Tax=Bradyrhizobium sp. TaxID=376 RepID=UPI0040377BDE
MSFHYPFRACAVLAMAALAAAAVVPAPARAQTANAALGDARADAPKSEAVKSEAARPAGAPPAGAGSTAAVQHNPAQKGIAARAVDKVRDIFARVPCLPPKGAGKSMGSLPHVANRLIAGQPVMIIAFGSSSTQGYGSSAPEFNYPNRLAAQLKRQYPTSDITVLNRGKGGEDAPEMMRRLQAEVIDMKPDLVIWQVGTNAVLRNLDQAETARLVDEGIARIQAAGSDVVLVDSQYSPAVNAKSEGNSRMMKLLGKVAELRKIGVFPRFEVMRDWHEKQAIPVEEFIISDGLHMSDWGYACFAQLLGDDIIKSVGQIKLGIAVPSDVRAYRPM